MRLKFKTSSFRTSLLFRFQVWNTFGKLKAGWEENLSLKKWKKKIFETLHPKAINLRIHSRRKKAVNISLR